MLSPWAALTSLRAGKRCRYELPAQPRAFQIALVSADQRDQMRARAVAHQHDPRRIDPQSGGVIDQIAQRGSDIGGLIFNRGTGHQPVIDRGIGITCASVVRRFPCAAGIVLAPALPTAAVDEYHLRGRGLRLLGGPAVKVLQGI